MSAVPRTHPTPPAPAAAPHLVAPLLPTRVATAVRMKVAAGTVVGAVVLFGGLAAVLG